MLYVGLCKTDFVSFRYLQSDALLGFCFVLHIVTQSCDWNPAGCVIDSCTVFIVVVNKIFTLHVSYGRIVTQ